MKRKKRKEHVRSYGEMRKKDVKVCRERRKERRMESSWK